MPMGSVVTARLRFYSVSIYGWRPLARFARQNGLAALGARVTVSLGAHGARGRRGAGGGARAPNPKGAKREGGMWEP